MIAKFFMYFAGGCILAHMALFIFFAPFAFFYLSLIVPGGSQATEGPTGPDIYHEEIAWGKGIDSWSPEEPYICPGSPMGHSYMRHHCTKEQFIRTQGIDVLFASIYALMFLPIRSINESWGIVVRATHVATPIIGYLIAAILLREDYKKEKQTLQSVHPESDGNQL